MYGDVQRVKILFNKKDNALVQYNEPQQAALGTDQVAWQLLAKYYILLSSNIFSYSTFG